MVNQLINVGADDTDGGGGAATRVLPSLLSRGYLENLQRFMGQIKVTMSDILNMVSPPQSLPTQT